jgi:hypothetical protein
MTARTKLGLLAAVAGCAALAWITFPAVLYAYYGLVYPLYYYPFRYRSVVREFPMKWEPLPPSVMNGLSLAHPAWLRFEENPNFGIVVDATQATSLGSHRDSPVPVLLSIHGDRRSGAQGFSVERIGAVPYGAAKPTATLDICADPPVCGTSPLHAAICNGPCGTPE